MNITDVILQLRAGAPIFEDRVAGAARYANAAADQTWLARPACYVVPAGMDAADNISMTGLWQTVTHHIGVIVDIDNSEDRRGQGSAAQVTDFFYALCKAIGNWRPDFDPARPKNNVETKGFRFTGGDVIDMDRARLRYQFNFALDTLLTDADCWHPPGVPLTEIQGSFINAATGAPLSGGFDIKFAGTP